MNINQNTYHEKFIDKLYSDEAYQVARLKGETL